MRILKLMPDYQCFPLWEASPDAVGNVNPGDLPISKVLQENLMLWAEKFDTTLDMDDPTQSGFKSNEVEENFRKTGFDLAEQLRLELGTEFVVETRF